MASLDYLLTPIRDELQQRITAPGRCFTAGLVIDFQPPGVVSAALPQPQHGSLFSAAGAVGDAANRANIAKLNLAGYAEAEFDCVVVNLQLAWCAPPPLFAAIKRILQPGGVLLFSSLGPDTLNTIQRAWSTVNATPYAPVVPTFLDMHHLGDALLQGGWVRPIVDVTRLAVEYPSLFALIADLRTLNPAPPREVSQSGLIGKQKFARLRAALPAPLPIQYEIIYGFAVRPMPVTVTVQPPAN